MVAWPAAGWEVGSWGISEEEATVIIASTTISVDHQLFLGAHFHTTVEPAHFHRRVPHEGGYVVPHAGAPCVFRKTTCLFLKSVRRLLLFARRHLL